MVNKTLSSWTKSVRELFDSSPFNREQAKTWSLEEFKRQANNIIEARFGEMDARQRAAEFGAAYLEQDQAGRSAVLKLLLDEFGVDADQVRDQIIAYEAIASENPDVGAARLRDALRPRREALLTRFTSLDDGFKFLVDMRAEILQRSREDESFKVLDKELEEIFARWFDPGFLDIERVTWSSSASLLEKLMQYEANHSIISWQDLKNRLDGDRRCYTLLHPRMGEEPLSILHVALSQGIATNVQKLLDVDSAFTRPETADTAVFYSVTSPQDGLRGISFGEIIIKQAVRELRSELPDLHTFVTLSPIPGFRKWLDKNLVPEDFDGLPFSADTLDSAIKIAASNGKKEWVPAFEKLMLRKALQHLTCLQNGKPINPVTRFHLRNGAYIHRVNYMGDTSANGLANGAGMMVNYCYNLKAMQNNLKRLHQGKLTVAGGLLKLAKQSGLDTEHLEAI